MTFAECLAETIALLRRHRRVSYRALKRQFGIDDSFLQDLKAEIIEVQRLAVDEGGTMLVLTDEPAPSAVAGAERRQLTVMFCDLVGSTELSARLDPEDLHEILSRYQRDTAAAIERFEGFVAQYLGDGILAYFGYPRAHEDDAQRAIHAALQALHAMQSANRSRPPGSPPVAVRIGIHTGPVVLSEVGSGMRREELALGETPNLAAKIQALAAPGSMLVSAATHRLVHSAFVMEPAAPLQIKGREALAVFRVLRARAPAETPHAAHAPPVLGRDKELQLLYECWTQCRSGAGQAVLLRGEAGIGKSRLVDALRAQAGRDRGGSIAFRCSPYFSNSALHPIIERLRQVLDFLPDDSAAERLGKIERALRGYRFPDGRSVPLLAALLSVPAPEGRYATLELTPLELKQHTAEVLIDWLMEEAERRPTLVVCEDLHWADASFLEWLGRLLDRLAATQLLLVLVFRPDFTPPAVWKHSARVVALSRLAPEDVAALVARQLRGRSLPPQVLQHIVAKTDGVPLFAEELLKAILESGMLVEEGAAYRIAGPLLETIPTTLQDSLMARLDRLGPAREVAQIAATVGREFPLDLIHAVAPGDARSLDEALGRLVAADLIFRRGHASGTRYVFKHALIRDVAYQSLLKSRRALIHGRIAHAMEERFPQLRETEPELLAHHYAEAGMAERAVDCLQKAAERAIERSAYVEALHHLDGALGLHKSLPQTPENARRELMLLTSQGLTLTPAKGYAAPELADTYARANELSRQFGEEPEIFPLLNGMWSFYLVRAHYAASRELAEKMLRVGAKSDSPVALIQANRALGVTLLYSGETGSGVAYLEKAVGLYDPARHRAFAYRLNGLDLGVSVRSFAAWGSWLLGWPAHALRRNEEMHEMARTLDHPYNSAWALTFSTWVHQMRREVSRTREQADAAIALATEHRFSLFRAISTILRGWAIALSGRADEGIGELRQGMEDYFATGAQSSRGHWAALLAEACLAAGRIDEGLRSLGEARIEQTGERYYEAEVHRLRGELERAASRGDAAGQAFEHALAVARAQRARSLELRAASSLFRLRRQQGSSDAARATLAEAYGFFSEGFDTADLQEAAGLLKPS